MTNEAQGLAYGSHHEQISLLSKRASQRGPALASMNGFVCICGCCVQIDRWSGGVGGGAVLTILLLGQMEGGVEAKGRV